MNSPTLEEFTALNDQLVALLEAGVRVDVGFSGSDRQVIANLERTKTVIETRVSRGESIDQVLADDLNALPPAYQGLLQCCLKSGETSRVLDSNRRLLTATNGTWQTLRMSLQYPLIVCTVAYLGLIASCHFFVPAITRLYGNLELQAGWALRVMMVLRATLPYWIGIPPLVLLAWVLWSLYSPATQRRTSSRRRHALRWLPGVSQGMRWEAQASFAESLATLLEHDVPLSDGLRWAAAASDDETLRATAEAIAASLARGVMPSESSSEAQRLPSFVRWALWHAEPTVGRARALRMASQVYRDSAERQLERVNTAMPMVACAVLGGSVTLLYGLAMFLPVIHLLERLS